MTEKKKHHYVPVSYLNNFSDADDKIFVFRKADKKVLHQSPSNTAFRRFYYSQPTPNGGQNNNALEDLFSSYETDWPTVCQWLETNPYDNKHLESLLTFLALQMVRVPATRDSFELSLAAMVHRKLSELKSNGEIPPPPKNFADLYEKLQVSIDPHRSIHAMKPILDSFALLLNQLGFMLVKNETQYSFITSDNPVFWFDPSKDFDKASPNTVERNGPIHLLFPITGKLLLVGTTEAKSAFSEYGLLEGKSLDENQVLHMNARIAKFAYEAFFANSSEWEFFVEEFHNHSPITVSETIPMSKGLKTIEKRTFGAIPRKPKWKRQS